MYVIPVIEFLPLPPIGPEAGEAFGLLARGETAACVERFGRRHGPALTPLVSAAWLRLGLVPEARRYLLSGPDLPDEDRELKLLACDLLEALPPLPDPAPRVHLLLPSHNPEFLEATLAALSGTTYPNLAVYALADGGAPELVAAMERGLGPLRGRFPVTLRTTRFKMGYSGALNLLLTEEDHSGAEFIAQCDDDVPVMDPGWITHFVRLALRFPDAGAVGGKAFCHGKPGWTQGAQYRFSSFSIEGFTMTNTGALPDLGRFDVIDRVDHVIPCVILYRRQAFEEAGLYDLRFSPGPYADVDHHLRLRLAGRDILYSGFSSCVHVRSTMNRDTREWMGLQRSRLLALASKHDPAAMQTFIRDQARSRREWIAARAGLGAVPAAPLPEEPDRRRPLLHAGCGRRTLHEVRARFDPGQWREVRLDIDPAVSPDIVASLADLAAVPDASFSAVFSAHGIEHLFPHEVLPALREMRRVLAPGGFAVVTCPDLKALAREVAEDRLLALLDVPTFGRVAPQDMIFGYRPELAAGNAHMAHRCGFTAPILAQVLNEAGFASSACLERPGYYDLWAVATVSPLSREGLTDLARTHFPA